MNSAARRESPLSLRHHERIEVAGLSVREVAFRTMLNLRAHPKDAACAQVIGDATGLSLPAINEFNAKGERLLAWLGPDEFLFVDENRDPDGIEERLRDHLPGVASALTDVSSGFTTLLVGGAGAPDLLARGWTLDLHPRAFRPGHCAQSYLAKAPVLLLQRDAAPVFEVIVRRSFADYLWTWLMASATACTAGPQ